MLNRYTDDLQISFVNPELLLKSYYGGTRFIEVPIRFIPREKGAAKGTKLKFVLRSVIDILRNWLAWGIRVRWQRASGQRIRRVSEPFGLNQKILRLILPLFEDFQ